MYARGALDFEVAPVGAWIEIYSDSGNMIANREVAPVGAWIEINLINRRNC